MVVVMMVVDIFVWDAELGWWRGECDGDDGGSGDNGGGDGGKVSDHLVCCLRGVIVSWQHGSHSLKPTQHHHAHSNIGLPF